MKTSFCAIACAFALAACSLLEPPLPMGHPRSLEREGVSGNTESGDDTPHKKDTAFLVSAVSFPSSYDWQRDSAFGAVDCTLLLFRDGKQVAEYPAGPSARISPSPDRHHIIDGALFTEYSDSRGTTVKMNGRELCSWAERELLHGLLYKGGTLHSIGIDRSGGGITYRRNGTVVLKVDGGSLMGGFSRDGYGSGGALYEDGGHVCFAYKSVLEGKQSVYLVTDGKARLLMSAPDVSILDAKMLDGTEAILYNQSHVTMLSYGGERHSISQGGGVYWERGSLVMYDGRPSVIGSYHVGEDSGEAVGWERVCVPLDEAADYIYCDGTCCLGLSQPPEDYPDCYFFHRNCACQLGNAMAMVLTPRDTDKCPYFIYGYRTDKFNIYGYLSGVAAVISE